MFRPLSRLRPLIILCATAVLFPACQNVPKYKKASGRFNEWSSYEGKHFEPTSGVISAKDLQANTVTITHGNDSKVYPIGPRTRIIHEGTDITLAELPLQESVKYTFADDGKELLTIWYGHQLSTPHAAAQHKEQNTFF